MVVDGVGDGDRMSRGWRRRNARSRWERGRGSGSRGKVSGVPAWSGRGLVAVGRFSFVGVGCVSEGRAAEYGNPNVGSLREVTRQVID